MSRRGTTLTEQHRQAVKVAALGIGILRMNNGGALDGLFSVTDERGVVIGGCHEVGRLLLDVMDYLEENRG